LCGHIRHIEIHGNDWLSTAIETDHNEDSNCLDHGCQTYQSSWPQQRSPPASISR
jgi:hypothetical protein